MQPFEIIRLILQTLSAFAIAGGFIFTAVQFLNYRRTVHVANFTKLVEMQMQLRRMRVDEPALAAVYRHDVQGIETDKEIREYFLNLMQLSVFEIVWYAHRHGQLADDYYESWVRRMEEIAREESFRKMMDNPAMKIMHDDFERYVTQMVDRSRAA
jgi:hypothetical protein